MLGRLPLIDRLRRHPLARALRVDKLTLAALQATLEGPGTPTWQALRTSPEALRQRTEQLLRALRTTDATIERTEAVVGGGGAPELTLPSWSLSLPEAYAVSLREGSPPIVGRVERGRLLLDLRCVPADRDADVAEAISRCTS
jgi:L-seryl-tRNA(Ser) seleniumtransferase